MIFAHLIPLLLLSTATATNNVVTGCGADPSGKYDSTPAFISCLASLPAGDLIIPPGTYNISGTISKTRNQNLIGSGSKASVLKCLSRTGPCLIIGDSSGGPNNYNVSTVENITLKGPGPENKSVGIYLGGDPVGLISPAQYYADGANFLNVRVTDFNRGVVWGNNAWGTKFSRSLIFANETGLYVPKGLTNSGENIGLTDTGVFNNKGFGIDDNSNFEWMLVGSSFDYNASAMQFYGATVHATNCHFEQRSGTVVIQPYGSGILSIRDSTILLHGDTGHDKFILSLWPQNLLLILDDVTVYSNHPVDFFMHASGNISGTVSGLFGNGNKMIHTLSDPSGLEKTIKDSQAF